MLTKRQTSISSYLSGRDESIEGAVGGRLHHEVFVVLELVLLDGLLLLRLEHRLQLLLGGRPPRGSPAHLPVAPVTATAAPVVVGGIEGGGGGGGEPRRSGDGEVVRRLDGVGAILLPHVTAEAHPLALDFKYGIESCCLLLSASTIV